MKNTLDYQGNKKSLLGFISDCVSPYIDKDKYFLDIFAGSGSVSLFFAQKFNVAFNDIEPYSSIIISSFLLSKKSNFKDTFGLAFSTFFNEYKTNKIFLESKLAKYVELEKLFLSQQDLVSYKLLQDEYPTIWNGLYSPVINNKLTFDNLSSNQIGYNHLFCSYYGNSYFSIEQCIEIDSIRYGIEKIKSNDYSCLFFAALYHAMNQCVFSKDGHMAQPLSVEKNLNRAILTKKKNFYFEFNSFLKKLCESDYKFSKKYKGFNSDFTELIKTNFFQKEISCVYADPPYTDMQYSRYYHLLNTVTAYSYDSPTILHGKFTKGLYLNNRSFSRLSCKKTCLMDMTLLMRACKLNKINLCISFGYPDVRSDEKKDRYVMKINDLISSCNSVFGSNNVRVFSEDYEHGNQRNSKKKKVIEYVICCQGNCHD